MRIASAPFWSFNQPRMASQYYNARDINTRGFTRSNRPLLVTALVDGVLLPVVTFFLPGGAWRTATLDLGAVHLILGPVFGAGLDFLIVAWLTFWFSKKVLREASVTKK